VVHFAVAAVYDRRNLLNQKTAVIDRRYSKAKLNHYRRYFKGPRNTYFIAIIQAV